MEGSSANQCKKAAFAGRSGRRVLTNGLVAPTVSRIIVRARYTNQFDQGPKLDSAASMGQLPLPTNLSETTLRSERSALHPYHAFGAKGLYGGACGDRRFGG